MHNGFQEDEKEKLCGIEADTINPIFFPDESWRFFMHSFKGNKLHTFLIEEQNLHSDFL